MEGHRSGVEKRGLQEAPGYGVLDEFLPQKYLLKNDKPSERQRG